MSNFAIENKPIYSTLKFLQSMLSRISSMIVMALLAMVSITSCSNEDIWDSSTEEAARREYYYNAKFYNAKFESMFGKIDPNQDWGFGIRGLSRAVDTQGNQWQNIPSVTYDEVVIVYFYLMTTNPTYVDKLPNYSSYYLTHVFGCHDSYSAYDESTTSIGSEHMDYFMAGEKQSARDGYTPALNENELIALGWTHVNDFNAAANTNFGGNMVLYDSGTYDFGWRNSQAENEFKNSRKYKIISGKDVLNWAKNVTWPEAGIKILMRNLSYVYQNHEFRNFNTWETLTTYFVWQGDGAAESTKEYFKDAIAKIDLSNINETEFEQYYYICFDFESYPKSSATDTYTEFDGISYTVTNADSSTETKTVKFIVPGLYKTLEEAKEAIKKLVQENPDSYQGLDANLSNISSNWSTTFTNRQGADKWVQPDDIYTDWVVRLKGPALRKTTDVARVLVEDLSVKALQNLDNTDSDWDFNDAVLDIYIYSTYDMTLQKNVSKAEITVKALGGTLPIYIGYRESEGGDILFSQELHSFLGVDYSTMVNTGLSTVSENTLILIGDFMTNYEADYDKVMIWVDVDITGDSTKYIEMNAKKGKAPCKIKVDGTFKWCRERVLVTNPYPKFTDWVGGRYDEQDNTSWYYNDLDDFDEQWVMP